LISSHAFHSSPKTAKAVRRMRLTQEDELLQLYGGEIGLDG
jgi:hypothetical protein